MNIFEAIVLGIVQGLTEFLPISSSAHVRVASELMGVGDPGSAFTAVMQIGTEIAVLLFFWRDITRILRQWFGSLRGRVARNDPDAHMGWLIIIGSVPIVILGLLFEKMIDTNFRSLWIVASMLIVFALVLAFADWYGKRVRSLKDLTFGHGLVYGFAQSLALIPGVSRSGGTITAGLLLGYTRAEAARYSFLLALPAILGSGGYKLVKAFASHEPATAAAGAGGVETVSLGLMLLATLVAFLVGFAVIKWFMNYLSRGSFMPFIVYRIALGLAIFLLLALHVIHDSPAGV